MSSLQRCPYFIGWYKIGTSEESLFQRCPLREVPLHTPENNNADMHMQITNSVLNDTTSLGAFTENHNSHCQLTAAGTWHTQVQHPPGSVPQNNQPIQYLTTWSDTNTDTSIITVAEEACKKWGGAEP